MIYLRESNILYFDVDHIIIKPIINKLRREYAK